MSTLIGCFLLWMVILSNGLINFKRQGVQIQGTLEVDTEVTIGGNLKVKETLIALKNNNCPNACSGHGTCNYGVCSCLSGYCGDTCQTCASQVFMTTCAETVGYTASVGWNRIQYTASQCTNGLTPTTGYKCHCAMANMAALGDDSDWGCFLPGETVNNFGSAPSFTFTRPGYQFHMLSVNGPGAGARVNYFCVPLEFDEPLIITCKASGSRSGMARFDRDFTTAECGGQLPSNTAVPLWGGVVADTMEGKVGFYNAEAEKIYGGYYAMPSVSITPDSGSGSDPYYYWFRGTFFEPAFYTHLPSYSFCTKTRASGYTPAYYGINRYFFIPSDCSGGNKPARLNANCTCAMSRVSSCSDADTDSGCYNAGEDDPSAPYYGLTSFMHSAGVDHFTYDNSCSGAYVAGAFFYCPNS